VYLLEEFEKKIENLEGIELQNFLLPEIQLHLSFCFFSVISVIFTKLSPP